MRARERARFILAINYFLHILSLMNLGNEEVQNTIPPWLKEVCHSSAVNQQLLVRISKLNEENARLGEENSKLRDRLLRLEEQLNTHSNNSSKPPSQDPFRKARQAILGIRDKCFY